MKNDRLVAQRGNVSRECGISCLSARERIDESFYIRTLLDSSKEKFELLER